MTLNGKFNVVMIHCYCHARIAIHGAHRVLCNASVQRDLALQGTTSGKQLIRGRFHSYSSASGSYKSNLSYLKDTPILSEKEKSISTLI